jgi:hypothetical protein
MRVVSLFPFLGTRLYHNLLFNDSLSSSDNTAVRSNGRIIGENLFPKFMAEIVVASFSYCDVYTHS